jgi:hypothetical protein
MINSSQLKFADSINIGHISLMRNKKMKFIPLPLKIGEIIVKNISHLDEFAIYFDHFKLREIHEI